VSTVAVYIEGFAETHWVAWAFIAPEQGHRASGVLAPGMATEEAASRGRYRAALEALQWALLAGYDKVLVHTDDQRLAQQLGVSRPPSVGRLRHAWSEVKAFEGCFFRVAYFWVEPELNAEARQLARATYEQHTGQTLDPDPAHQARSIELVPVCQLAMERGLEVSRPEDQQFLLWLIETPTPSLGEISQEQLEQLLQRLTSLTQAELFRLRVFYLRSLLGRVG